MAEAFLQLSDGERRGALGVAADRSGRPAHLLEKDVWVVRALRESISTTGLVLEREQGASTPTAAP